MKKIAIALFAVVALSAGWYAYACDDCAAHAKKAEASASADKGGCPHANKAEAKAGCGGCSAKKQAACAKALQDDTKLTTYTGRVLCTHCNLKKTESCGTVFQMKGEEETMALCPHTKDIAGLRKAGDHGKKVLEVKGHICEDEDGQKRLMVASWSKGDV